MENRVAPVVLFAALCVLQGCAPADQDGDQPPVTRANPVIVMDTGTARIITDSDTLRVSVEIAEDRDQRQVGLMERDSLPEDEGMLFLMDETRPGSAGFWMARTRIPLDIAYIDSAGAIVATLRMEPCTSAYSAECPQYPPGVPYRAALEVVAGYFDAHGVEVGDRVELISREGSLVDGMDGQ